MTIVPQPGREARRYDTRATNRQILTRKPRRGIYGVLPLLPSGGSVPPFDPYNDEWGHQLEED
jgi:hypothetical protein